jgi:N-acetylated-alpha-linked acidic dipeptidase
MVRGKVFVWSLAALALSGAAIHTSSSRQRPAALISRTAADQQRWEKLFLAVPDPEHARLHLRTLTSAPHMAGTPEDKRTADYVAAQFRAAGLQTEIAEYKVWMNYPSEISVDLIAPAGVKLHGPTREHLEGAGPAQDDARVVMPFSGYSPSGDVEGEVVYANYGRPEDFKKLADLKIDVRGKIVIARYGQNFRGVKAYVAQEHGAAGLLIYSDPLDDGYFRGDVYPAGPWRPSVAVQRGSVGYIFKFPGDATTPGVASVPDLPDAQRTPPSQSAELPRIPTTPLCYADAQPILAHLGGPASPREWQGALPFTYHLGPGPARIRMHLKQDYQYRTIWDVVGRVPGTEDADELVLAGNHRDAWVYGAVDPNSGTTAMLEAVRGLGELLRAGWRPRRTIVIGSWDAEEQGLIGSTEWGEQHAAELAHAVAYFNTDPAVSGPNFSASAVPSLKQFVIEVSQAVPSVKGGTVYDQWRRRLEQPRETSPDLTGSQSRAPLAPGGDVPVGDLGSGSDYTVFFQHLGIPATDVESNGAYIYHSVFDNFEAFSRFADPDFRYEQQMARIYGLEILRMADARRLPFDYARYGGEVMAFLDAAKKKAALRWGPRSVNFDAAAGAAKRFRDAGALAGKRLSDSPDSDRSINATLRQAERMLLLPEGLPDRPWYKHAIFAPGVYTGYAAVALPGVNEAIDAGNLGRAQDELGRLAQALNLAADVLQQPR